MSRDLVNRKKKPRNEMDFGKKEKMSVTKLLALLFRPLSVNFYGGLKVLKIV